jgi:hypothetical protein
VNLSEERAKAFSETESPPFLIGLKKIFALTYWALGRSVQLFKDLLGKKVNAAIS